MSTPDISQLIYIMLFLPLIISIGVCVCFCIKFCPHSPVWQAYINVWITGVIIHMIVSFMLNFWRVDYKILINIMRIALHFKGTFLIVIYACWNTRGDFECKKKNHEMHYEMQTSMSKCWNNNLGGALISLAPNGWGQAFLNSTQPQTHTQCINKSSMFTCQRTLCPQRAHFYTPRVMRDAPHKESRCVGHAPRPK